MSTNSKISQQSQSVRKTARQRTSSNTIGTNYVVTVGLPARATATTQTKTVSNLNDSELEESEEIPHCFLCLGPCLSCSSSEDIASCLYSRAEFDVDYFLKGCFLRPCCANEIEGQGQGPCTRACRSRHCRRETGCGICFGYYNGNSDFSDETVTSSDLTEIEEEGTPLSNRSTKFDINSKSESRESDSSKIFLDSLCLHCCCRAFSCGFIGLFLFFLLPLLTGFLFIQRNLSKSHTSTYEDLPRGNRNSNTKGRDSSLTVKDMVEGEVDWGALIHDNVDIKDESFKRRLLAGFDENIFKDSLSISDESGEELMAEDISTLHRRLWRVSRLGSAENNGWGKLMEFIRDNTTKLPNSNDLNPDPAPILRLPN